MSKFDRLLSILTFLLLASACQRDAEPFPPGILNLTDPVVSLNLGAIRVTKATVHGRIEQAGNTRIVRFGFVWDTLPEPTPGLTSTKVEWIDPKSDTFSFKIEGLFPGKKYYVRSFAENKAGTEVVSSQQTFQTLNYFEQLPNYPSYMVSDQGIFSLDGKVFVVAGTFHHKDVWRFDPSNNSWTQKNDFPGKGVNSPGSFSIGNTGYICLGSDVEGPYTPTKELWAYNAPKDSFFRRADFPGEGRQSPVCFVIDGIAYVGMGETKDIFYRDMYAYDPQIDQWTPVMSFLGDDRSVATCFVVGNKGYVGYGSKGSIFPNDFWEFDPSNTNNPWDEVSSVPGPRVGATGFTINNKGYMLGGSSNELWEFAPQNSADSIWTRLPNYPDIVSFTTAIGLNQSAIIVGGRYGVANNDQTSFCWKFNLDE